MNYPETTAATVSRSYLDRMTEIRSGLWSLQRNLKDFSDRIEGNPTPIKDGPQSAPSSGALPSILNDIEEAMQQLHQWTERFTATF